MSEKTANRVKEIFCQIISDDKIDTLIGNLVNTKTVKNKIQDWVTLNCVNNKIEKMFIYINGHGNQVPDNNGEEIDNLDELLQLPDGGG